MAVISWLNHATRLAAAAVIVLPLAAGCGKTEDGPVSQMVYRVDKLTVKRLAQSPPAIVIEAEGMAPTAAWTDIRLEPQVMVDDELTYHFVGTPPKEMAAQVLSPVKAARLVDPLPENVGKIRVAATGNALVEEVPPEE